MTYKTEGDGNSSICRKIKKSLNEILHNYENHGISWFVRSCPEPLAGAWVEGLCNGVATVKVDLIRWLSEKHSFSESHLLDDECINWIRIKLEQISHDLVSISISDVVGT